MTWENYDILLPTCLASNYFSISSILNIVIGLTNLGPPVINNIDNDKFIDNEVC